MYTGSAEQLINSLWPPPPLVLVMVVNKDSSNQRQHSHGQDGLHCMHYAQSRQRERERESGLYNSRPIGCTAGRLCHPRSVTESHSIRVRPPPFGSSRSRRLSAGLSDGSLPQYIDNAEVSRMQTAAAAWQYRLGHQFKTPCHWMKMNRFAALQYVT